MTTSIVEPWLIVLGANRQEKYPFRRDTAEGQMALEPFVSAADHPRVERPRATSTRRRGELAEAWRCYLRKIGGLPAEGSGSDVAVFNAALWARTNAPDLGDVAFAAVAQEFRPELRPDSIEKKWRSSRGAA